MTFSRLEAREILAHLDDDCDPDVIEKLREIAQSKTRTLVTFKAAIQEPLNQVQLERAELALRSNFELFDPPANQRCEHTEGTVTVNGVAVCSICHNKGWSTADIARVNEERRITFAAQSNMSGGIPFTAIADKPALPSGFGIERVAVGDTNSVGDKCIRIDDRGFSVYVCPEGHGYIGDNEAFKGCSQCEMGGTTVTRQQIEDRGAIAGFDSNW